MSDCRESRWELRLEADRKATRSLVDHFDDAMAIFTRDEVSIQHEDGVAKVAEVQRVAGKGEK